VVFIFSFLIYQDHPSCCDVPPVVVIVPVVKVFIILILVYYLVCGGKVNAYILLVQEKFNFFIECR
jgi:hypothetical protein